MAKIDVKVPDIGDFKDVPVIEVLVKVGDTVEAEQPIVTLESDKASMDVPSPAAGKITEIVVKVGDKVSMGALIAKLDAGGPAAPISPEQEDEAVASLKALADDQLLPTRRVTEAIAKYGIDPEGPNPARS